MLVKASMANITAGDPMVRVTFGSPQATSAKIWRVPMWLGKKMT